MLVQNILILIISSVCAAPFTVDYKIPTNIGADHTEVSTSFVNIPNKYSNSGEIVRRQDDFQWVNFYPHIDYAAVRSEEEANKKVQDEKKKQEDAAKKQAEQQKKQSQEAARAAQKPIIAKAGPKSSTAQSAPSARPGKAPKSAAAAPATSGQAAGSARASHGRKRT